MPLTGSALQGRSWLCSRSSPERYKSAGNALRESQYEHKNDDAEQSPPILGLPHHRILQGRKDRSADDRAAECLDAAKQYHDEAVDRPADMDRFRRYRALRERKQSPRDTTNTAGDGKSEPMHALHIDSDCLGAQRGVPARAHRIAKGRKQEAAQQQDTSHGESQSEQEIDPGFVERRRRPDADDAIGAPC